MQFLAHTGFSVKSEEENRKLNNIKGNHHKKGFPNYKIDGYQIFEKIRPNRDGGGGIMTLVKEEMSPVWVSEGDDNVEIMSVNIQAGSMTVRVINGYGFQENNSDEKKNKFWNHMNKEVDEANNNNEDILIQLDGNIWVGSEIIPGDPNPQNKGGKIFYGK